MHALASSTMTPRRQRLLDAASTSDPARVAALANELEASLGNLSSLATLLEAAHEEASRANLIDPLTRCPNRVLFKDRVEQTLLAARRTGASIPLLVVDLDHFKEVNETLGYAAGDDLLCEVARRLRASLRDSDTVARLGSDDFGILLSSTDTLDGAVKVADRVHREVASEAVIAGQRIGLTMTVGIAVHPTHGTDAETLLRHADMALSEARRARLPYAVFSSEEHDPSRSSLRLAAELRSAVENDELVLHYQPKIFMGNGRTVGVEALVRWQHPIHGLVMPGDFMPLAERTATITPMSLKILAKALGQVRAWQDMGLDVPVAINLSPRSLHQTDLPDRIAESLTEAGVAADKLAIEITETAIMIDEASAESVVRRLADQGVRISIDDFGTGYSSLTRLRRLPVSELKVDRSFVRNMARDNEDRVIVHALVDLGHRLGQKIVAEGVEDDETMKLLGQLGCDAVQGYHVCRPLPAVKLTDWLRTSPNGCGPAGTLETIA